MTRRGEARRNRHSFMADKTKVEWAAHCYELKEVVERLLLEYDFLVESKLLPDNRNDIIFVDARKALEKLDLKSRTTITIRKS